MRTCFFFPVFVFFRSDLHVKVAHIRLRLIIIIWYQMYKKNRFCILGSGWTIVQSGACRLCFRSLPQSFHCFVFRANLLVLNFLCLFFLSFACRSLSKQSFAISRHLTLDPGHYLQHQQPLLPQPDSRGDTGPSWQLWQLHVGRLEVKTWAAVCRGGVYKGVIAWRINCPKDKKTNCSQSKMYVRIKNIFLK